MTENFRRISLESAPRSELHDALGLTGCEVSVNALPAGATQFEGFCIIKSVSVRQNIKGTDYLDLVLADAEGEAVADECRPELGAGREDVGGDGVGEVCGGGAQAGSPTVATGLKSFAIS